MLNASEVKAMTDGYEKHMLKSELKEVENLINLAASTCYTSVIVKQTLDEETEKILKDLGYQIETHFAFQDHKTSVGYTVIKWG